MEKKKQIYLKKRQQKQKQIVFIFVNFHFKSYPQVHLYRTVSEN